MVKKLSFLLLGFALFTAIYLPIPVEAVGENVVQGTGYSFDTTGGINELTVLSDEGFNNIYLSESGITKADIKSVIIGANVTEVAQEAFMNCTALTSVTFAESSTELEIGIDAFNASGLTSIAIPKNVSSIGVRAFNDCSDLTTVTFDTRTEQLFIGSEAFKRSGITSIHIPNSVSYISGNTFENCKDLTTVTFEENSIVSYFNGYAFAGSGITQISIPKSVKSLGNYSFSGCADLQSVTFDKEAQLSSIPLSCFVFSGLKSITIPKSVTSISSSAFSSCKSLTDVYFEPDSQLQTIKASAFYSSGLTNINLPNSVTSIDSTAFRSCDNLTSIIIPANVTSIGSNAFQSVPLSRIYFEGNYPTTDTGMSSIDTGATKYHAADATGYNSFGSTPAYTVSGVVTTGSGTPVQTKISLMDNTTELFSTTSDIFGQYKVPMEVGDSGTLEGSYGGVGFSENVTATDHLTVNISIASPYEYNAADGVLTVNDDDGMAQVMQAFSDETIIKTNIKTLIIGTKVTAISDSAFSGCTNLAEIIFIENGSLQSIGSAAFGGTNATRLIIPATVDSIAENAFASMPLNWIYFKGNIPTDAAGISSITQTAKKYYHPDATGYDASFAPAYLISGKVTDEAGLPLLANVTISLNSSPILTDSTDQNGSYIIPAEADTALELVVAHNIYITHTENITPAADIENKNIALRQAYSWDDNTRTLTIIEPEGFSLAFEAVSGVNKSNLNNVIIGEKITEIPNDAFSGCAFLVGVTFESNDNLTKIGDRAFQGCRLRSVNIPSSVVSIGSEAFTLSNVHDFSVTFIEQSQLQTIGNSAFKGTRLKSIEIPANVTAIGDYAFAGCNLLDQVSFMEESKLLSIGNNAFEETDVFQIDIPEAVTTIGQEAFKNSSKLQTINFAPDNAVTSIGRAAFAGTNLREFTLPDKVTTIAANTFEGSEYLHTVTFNSSVKRIEDNAFRGTDLKAVNLPSSVTHIGANAFENCSQLSVFNFNADSSLTNIGANVFAATALRGIKLPPSITDIDENAFSNTLLTWVYIDGNYPTGDLSGITSSTLGKFYSPGATGYENTGFVPAYLFSGVVTFSNKVLAQEAYILTKTDDTEISITQSDEGGIYTIPVQADTEAELVAIYGGHAYEQSITATEDTTLDIQLEDKFFYLFGALEIRNEAWIPNIFTQYTGMDKERVETLVIPEYITQIPDNPFSGCENLSKVNFSGSPTLTSIGANAFSFTALTGIDLPATVNAISSGAFANNELRYIYFDGNYYSGLQPGINTLPENTAVLHNPTALYWESKATPLSHLDVYIDGLINMMDLREIALSENYNKQTDEIDNPRCDVNGDGKVNFLDMSIVRSSKNFG